ncbi:MAG: hypothetical protein IT479_05870 [Xanthomonadales bacterium]|nr:hypothetical protein [Xanthomonadales bacterium]MCC6592786.1 hypothetical protein [Xanthomonadales bacterium]
MNTATSSRTTHPDPRSDGMLGGPIPLILTVLVCGWFVHDLPPVPDHASQFHMAQRMLEGAVLYSDVAASEMHPPLLTWLAALLVIVGRALAISGLDLMPVCVALSVATSLCLIWRVGPRSVWVLMVAAMLLLPLSDAYFGQGEHLAVTWALPYLFATADAGTELPRRLRIVVALMAALGLALKPHFALVWVVAELYRARRHGWRSVFRLEGLLIGASFAGYLLIAAGVHPEYFHNLPWLAALYPKYFPTPLTQIVRDARGALLLAAVLLPFALRDSREWVAAARLLGLAGAAMYLAMLLQQKGWGYHWYPIVACSGLSLAICVRRWAHRHAALAIPLVASVTIMLASAQRLRVEHVLQKPPTELGPMLALVQAHAGGRPIAALSRYIQAGFPLAAEAGVEWALPDACLWTLHVLQQMPQAERRRWAWLERASFERVWAALEARRPALLIVERETEAGPDMRRYFETDARYRRLFERAKIIGSTPTYVVYALHQPP